MFRFAKILMVRRHGWCYVLKVTFYQLQYNQFQRYRCMCTTNFHFSLFDAGSVINSDGGYFASLKHEYFLYLQKHHLEQRIVIRVLKIDGHRTVFFKLNTKNRRYIWTVFFQTSLSLYRYCNALSRLNVFFFVEAWSLHAHQFKH